MIKFSIFSKFSDSRGIFIFNSNSESLFSISLSDESSSDKLVSSLFLGDSVCCWLLLNFGENELLNIFSRILCGSKRVFSVSSSLFVEDDSVSVSRSYSCIKENSLISEGFSFSSSDFGVLGDFSDFEYFDLNFLVIFGDSDLEVEGEFLGIFITFSSKLFLKISICSILFSTSSISIGIGSKIIVWQSSEILLIIAFLFLPALTLITLSK